MMYSQTISLVTTDNCSRSLHCIQSQWQFQIFRSLHVLLIHIFKRILFVTFIIISIAFACMFINSKNKLHSVLSVVWPPPFDLSWNFLLFARIRDLFDQSPQCVKWWPRQRMLGREDAIVKSQHWNNGAVHTKEASTVATSSSDMSAQTTSSCLDQREVILLIW
jgi:hypothetical protein